MSISYDELRQYSKQKFFNEREEALGADGEPGISAYDIAVSEGFTGTKQEWLDSLKGADGQPGKSAYEAAVEAGFTGTEQEFNEMITAPSGGDSAGDIKQSSNTPTERGFVKCDGSVYLKSEYPSVAQKIGNIIDNFDLDNLSPTNITIGSGYIGDEHSAILSSSDGKLVITRKTGSPSNTFYVYDLDNNDSQLYRSHSNCPSIYSAVLLDDDTLAITHWNGIKVFDISRTKMSSDGGFLPSEPSDIFTWGVSGNYQLVMSPDNTKVLAYKYQQANGTYPTVFVFDKADMSTPLQEFTDSKSFYTGEFDPNSNSVIMSTTITTERLKRYDYSDGTTEVVLGSGGTWRTMFIANNQLYGFSNSNCYKIDTILNKVSLFNNDLGFAPYDSFVFNNKYVVLYYGDTTSNTGIALLDCENNYYVEKETIDNTSSFSKKAFTLYNNILYILHFRDDTSQYDIVTKLSLYSYDPETEFALPNEVSRILNAESVHAYIKKED